MMEKPEPILLRYGGVEKDTMDMTREELEQFRPPLSGGQKKRLFLKAGPSFIAKVIKYLLNGRMDVLKN